MNKERLIRKVTGYGKQPKINIPPELGFKLEDYVEFIKIDENSVKIVKIELVQKVKW